MEEKVKYHGFKVVGLAGLAVTPVGQEVKRASILALAKESLKGTIDTLEDFSDTTVQYKEFDSQEEFQEWAKK